MEHESTEEYYRALASHGKAMSLKRHGHEIAEDLLATLTTSSRLAALVKTLRLGVEVDSQPERPEWTQTNIRVLRLCRNVEHVEIRGFHHSELDELVEALKETSLVTFCMSKRIPSPWPPLRRVGRFSQLFDMLQRWPRLRSIKVEDFLADETGEVPLASDVSQTCRCPDLQEIILPGISLHDFELRALRSICGNITKFSASLFRERVGARGHAAADTLCECLRAWSSTLEYLKIDVPEYRDANRPLAEAIVSLRALRELQVTKLKLDLAHISRLPLLERFACLSGHRWEEISHFLEDSECFPSLIFIAIEIYDLPNFEKRMRDLCDRRKIELQEWRLIYHYEDYNPAPRAGFQL